jgi:sugar lactone lactonase YvrE
MDGQGHIYVGEYSDGRVQAFDSEGKFLSMWSIGKDQSLLALAAGRDGTVYAVVPGHITRYQGSTGMPLGEVETTLPSADDPNVDYESYTDACVAPTGDLYALGQNSDVVDCTPDGKIKSLFKASEKVGESMDPSRLLVVPTGEIFVLDRQKGVFKFASDGRYINRFGAAGEDADPSHPDPSHFLSPENLAADSQGRIYVSDADPAIRVFNPDGAYIDSFGTNDVAFGMVITDKDEIFASFRNQHSIEKFVLDPKK